MNKYIVYFAKNYKRPGPLMVDWDYELIGDRLRGEFDVYFEKQEQLAQAGAGKTKQLLKGEYVHKFMISKRINLVDDKSNGNLKSVFLLRPEEKKEIDERAKVNLASRYEYKVKKNSDGTETEPIGFLKFELTEGSETKDAEKEAASLQVAGNDIQYFKEEEVETKELFACEVCGKEFDSKRGLHAHGLSHKGGK